MITEAVEELLTGKYLLETLIYLTTSVAKDGGERKFPNRLPKAQPWPDAPLKITIIYPTTTVV